MLYNKKIKIYTNDKDIESGYCGQKISLLLKI